MTYPLLTVALWEYPSILTMTMVSKSVDPAFRDFFGSKTIPYPLNLKYGKYYPILLSHTTIPYYYPILLSHTTTIPYYYPILSHMEAWIWKVPNVSSRRSCVNRGTFYFGPSCHRISSWVKNQLAWSPAGRTCHWTQGLPFFQAKESLPTSNP